MRHVVIVLAITAVALSGCLDGHRVVVAEASLDASPMPWTRTDGDETGEALGLKVTETLYVHRGDDDTEPPYPGSLQVFSLRGGDSQDRAWLLERARNVVGQAAVELEIDIDVEQDLQGRRELRNGVATSWFTHEGTIAAGGGGTFLSPESDIKVRILGEVGVDGRSKTGFIAVAFAKIEGQQDGIGFGVGRETVHSDTTWREMVSDPSGSIGGASYSSADRGLIYNLVTNG